jgi:NAD-dependent DNA ligase
MTTTIDPTFKKIMEFAESDEMKQYIVDIRSHIDEIAFQTTIQLGLTMDELDEICDMNIAETTPEWIYKDSFEHKFGYLFWRLFKYRNWNPETEKSDDEQKELMNVPTTITNNLKVSVGGTLNKFSLNEFKEFVVKNGHKYTDKLDNDTNILVTNDRYSNKYYKARELGIGIYTEEEYLNLVEKTNNGNV